MRLNKTNREDYAFSFELATRKDLIHLYISYCHSHLSEYLLFDR